jgi:hypothetical protein
MLLKIHLILIIFTAVTFGSVQHNSKFIFNYYNGLKLITLSGLWLAFMK